MVELICSDVLPKGTCVMLSEAATLEQRLTYGDEAVMRILFPMPGKTYFNTDGDLVVERSYWVEHLHRGRLYHDVPESILRVIGEQEAQGQRLLHAEQTKDLVDALGIHGHPALMELRKENDAPL